MANEELRKVRWVIPYAPPSLNEWTSMHWARRKVLKDEWYESVFGLLNGAATTVPSGPWCYAAATIVFRTNARRDLSNYDATLWKILPDALVHYGVIPDDRAHQMRRGQVTFAIDRDLAGYGRHPAQKGVTIVALMVPVSSGVDANV